MLERIVDCWFIVDAMYHIGLLLGDGACGYDINECGVFPELVFIFICPAVPSNVIRTPKYRSPILMSSFFSEIVGNAWR